MSNPAANHKLPPDELRLLRYPEVCKKVALSRSEITARIRRGDFPKPVLLGSRAVAFPGHEVDLWIEGLLESRVAHG